MISPNPPDARSFWRELADGTAGPVARIVINFVLAVALTGLCPILAYLLALMVPAWGNRYGSGVYPTDELLAGVIVVAAGAFIIATVWLWSGRWRTIVRP